MSGWMFYGDLVYKFKKSVGRANLSDHFKNYYHMMLQTYWMRQSAYLVLNPIMVHNFASLFNCTPVGRASDSMMATT